MKKILKKEKSFKKGVLVGVLVVAIIILASLLLIKGDSEKNANQEVRKTTVGNNENIYFKEGEDNSLPVKKISQTDYIFGDINAPVHIIIYDDFECLFCANFFDTIEQAKKEFSDKIAIAFRHFPLNFHPFAFPAALASECAGEQGKFWQMYEKLFEANKNDNLNTARFKLDAMELGLDITQFNQCLDGEKYAAKIKAQAAEAKTFNVSGTPTTFVNGEIIVGAYPMDDFQDSSGRREGLRNIILRHLNN